MYSVSRGYGIFDTGATGNAISKVQLEKLMEDDPSAFGEIDSGRVKTIGFGGGTRVRSLGVCPQTSTTGPLSNSTFERDVSDNPGQKDSTPPLIPISWARQNRVVFDFETGNFIYKNDPATDHSAKSGVQSNGAEGPRSY